MSSTLAKPQQPQEGNSRPARSPSRPNVRHITSSIPRTGPRPAVTGLRSKSPALTNPNATAAKPPASPEAAIRKGKAPSRSNSLSEISDGIGNLNRWSQSTGSSKSSGIAGHKRSGSFARRLSGTFHAASSSAKGAQLSASTLSNTTVLQISHPVPLSGPALVAPRSPAKLTSGRKPTTATLAALSQAVEAATITSADETAAISPDILTHATYMPGSSDYFGETWEPPSQPGHPHEEEHIESAATTPSGARIQPGANNSFAEQPQDVVPPIPQSRSEHRRRDRDVSSRQSGARHRERSQRRVPPGEAERGSRSGHGDRTRRRRGPSQKAMLSRALQMANHAVVLDHAQNFEGAMDAYGDACDLLQQVMLRSPGDEDRKKLESIRVTYIDRISELQNNELQLAGFNDKALPQVPMRIAPKDKPSFSAAAEGDVDMAALESATATRVAEDIRQFSKGHAVTLSREQLPPRHQSLMPFSSSEDEATLTPRVLIAPQVSDIGEKGAKGSGTGLLVRVDELAGEHSTLPSSTSPRKRPSPSVPHEPSTLGKPVMQTIAELEAKEPVPPPLLVKTFVNQQIQHTRTGTVESTSWLDTVGESGGSSASSLHSRSSSYDHPIQSYEETFDGSNSAFGAAFDAAVDAAYDDEDVFAEDDVTFTPSAANPIHVRSGSISVIKKKLAIAKERAREAEQEALMAAAKDRERSHGQDKYPGRHRSESIKLEYDDEEAEEEERILEEMTRDYVMDDMAFDVQSKSALPRQSGSSGFSGRTWGSSSGSTATAGTPLSTVREAGLSENSLPGLKRPPPLPTMPHPTGQLPQLPPTFGPAPGTTSARPSKPPTLASVTSPGVRERRLSGQKIKQLKIDTTNINGSGPSIPPRLQSSSFKTPTTTTTTTVSRSAPEELKPSAISRDTSKDTLTPASKQPSWDDLARAVPTTIPSDAWNTSAPSSGQSSQVEKEVHIPAVPHSPSRGLSKTAGPGGTLRKNFSSSSLKSLRQPIPTPPAADDTPSTPLSRVFSLGSQAQRSGSVPQVPELPAPSVAQFAKGSLPPGTLSFFDNDLHGPNVSGASSSSANNAPLPLEPCPESFLLRPFWLLRCVYNTIAHPRGGYMSSRLFLPRDIWRVRNVKLKNVEEKTMNCDLLTAALLRLAKADTLDADSLYEEMQAFEAVLDQAQAALTKKLGADVGVQGSVVMFRASSTVEESGPASDAQSTKSAASSSKSYLAGWRKLRSKQPMGPSTSSTASSISGKEISRETLTMRSLPMTTSLNPRFVKRDVGQVKGIGPNAAYMMALARLCDAAQVVDQIARQVEDPGLKFSSQTQVGLELSSRHAAEFFAFYICRFVLTDLTMMLDKFIKRGSEWMLV